MKTRDLMKSVAIMALSTVLLVSCGKENTSNDKKKSSSTNYGLPSGGGFGNGSALPNNWIDLLIRENPCINYVNGTSDNRRKRIVVDLNAVNVNAGSMFAGITAEGDVGVVSVKSNRPVIEIWSCIRPDMDNSLQAYPMSANGVQPVFNVSQNCSVGEITALNIGMQTRTGSYNLAFYPIYLDSLNKPSYGSSLCQY